MRFRGGIGMTFRILVRIIASDSSYNYKEKGTRSIQYCFLNPINWPIYCGIDLSFMRSTVPCDGSSLSV